MTVLQRCMMANADALSAYVAAATPQDGRMSASDIRSYEAKTRDAVCAPYRTYTICGMGPPSSGGVAVAQMLGQLERFDIAALGPEQRWNSGTCSSNRSVSLTLTESFTLAMLTSSKFPSQA